MYFEIQKHIAFGLHSVLQYLGTLLTEIYLQLGSATNEMVSTRYLSMCI
jgi:hypothetical protein